MAAGRDDYPRRALLTRYLLSRPLLLGAAWLAWGALGCSLLVDADPVQCRNDHDCMRFGRKVCDPVQQVCVNPALVPAEVITDAGAAFDARPDAGAAVGMDAVDAPSSVDTTAPPPDAPQGPD